MSVNPILADATLPIAASLCTNDHTTRTENQSPIRTRICAGLGFRGLQLDESRNATHVPVVFTNTSRVTVRVIRADEELMIADPSLVCSNLALNPRKLKHELKHRKLMTQQNTQTNRRIVLNSHPDCAGLCGVGQWQ